MLMHSQKESLLASTPVVHDRFTNQQGFTLLELIIVCLLIIAVFVELIARAPELPWHD